MEIQTYIYNAGNRATYKKIFALIVTANIFICYLVYALIPDARPYLLGEDKIVETISALLFLAAFVIGLPRVFVLRRERQYWVLVLATFLGLLGFLDEMSFGGRIFVIDYPRIYDVKFDGAHDLFYFAAKTVKVLADKFGYIIYISIIAAGAFIPTFIMIKKYAAVKKFYCIIVDYTPYYFMAIFCCFIFLALLIDLGFIMWKPLILLEELLEMNAALALIFCSRSARHG